MIDLQYSKLIEAAKVARENAIAPFSKFKVGAAILGKSGEIYLGANIEPAVLNLGLCAEELECIIQRDREMGLDR